MSGSEGPKRGRFWLPESPDRVIGGSLAADFREIVLELEDSLAAIPTGQSPAALLTSDPLSYPIVLGLVDGELVTLETVYGDRSWSWTHGRVQVRERYNAMRIALGAHLSEIVLTELHVELDALQLWAPPPPIVPDHAEGEGVPARIAVTYTEPLPLRTSTDLGEIEISWPSSWSVGDDFNLKPSTVLTVRLTNPLRMGAAIDAAVAPLRALVALGIGSSCAVTSLHGVPTDSVVAEASPLRHHVNLLYLQTGQPPVALPSRYYAPFTLANVRDRLDDVIARWLRVWRELRTVCDLYFATVFSPPQHPEVLFLLTCQAVELIHSLRYEPLRRSKNEHRTLVDGLVSHLPAEHHEWSRRALIESNRKHLREQLLELIEHTPSGVRSALGDRDALAQLATRTRHGYTHWTQREQAARGGELIGLTERLRLMVQAFFLHELGFDDIYVDEWLDRGRIRERLAHWATAPEFA